VKEKLKKVIYKKENPQNQQMARKVANQRKSKEKLQLKTPPETNSP
jgi:threonine aldolase